MTTITYAIDAATDDIVVRHHGRQHGDGQVDTDAAPVWLLSSEDAAREAGVDVETLPRVDIDAPAEEMTTTTRYIACTESEIPDGVRFDVPRRNQGQTVEVAYGGLSRAEHDEGDPYKRVLDHSIGPNAYSYFRAAS